MTVEGKVSTGGSETWYRVVGNPAGSRSRKLPVLALHGGPGLPHESLEPLEALADGGRQVVFYDQLGCGNSTRAGNPDPWGVDPFLEELAALRRELGLARVHLLGHSWGGMLAMEHALGGAGGLASLILVGAVVSGPMVFECRRRFYEKLPPNARETIHRNEAAGTFDDPEYAEAMDLFYRRYACRLDPWPGWLNRALSKMDVEANAVMWGPPGAPEPGPLATLDLRPRLGGIGAPTLVVAGRHDGMTSGQEGEIQAGIPGSKLTIFEESSHYPFAEERERFLATLGSFLAHAERRAGP